MNIAIAAAGLAAALATTAGLAWPATRLDIRTQIDIAASPEEIWAVLADIGNYGEWNPYHVSVEGRLAKGEKLAVEVLKPNGETVRIPPHVITVEPGKRLVWGGGMPGIFRGEHTFELEAAANGCTRLVHRETFSGLFVGFAELGFIEEGYDLMNAALKRRTETRNGGETCPPSATEATR